MNSALETVPKDRNGKLSKDYLRVSLDALAPSAGLPPIGALEQVYFQLRENLPAGAVCLIYLCFPLIEYSSWNYADGQGYWRSVQDV